MLTLVHSYLNEFILNEEQRYGAAIGMLNTVNGNQNVLQMQTIYHRSLTWTERVSKDRRWCKIIKIVSCESWS